MKKEQIKKATDFLGIKVLNPLQEKQVVGGFVDAESHHHDGRHHHDTSLV